MKTIKKRKKKKNNFKMYCVILRKTHQLIVELSIIAKISIDKLSCL